MISNAPKPDERQIHGPGHEGQLALLKSKGMASGSRHIGAGIHDGQMLTATLCADKYFLPLAFCADYDAICRADFLILKITTALAASR